MLSGGGNGRGGCHVGIKALSAEVGIILCRGDSLSGCLSLGILLGGEHEVHVELEKRFLLTSRNWTEPVALLVFSKEDKKQVLEFSLVSLPIAKRTDC
jgi:hypothetical protein